MAFDCPRQCFALLAVLCAVSAVGQRTGRCHGSGYMNLAWSGMSKSKCLERAFEVNKAPGPAGQCGYVSYSGSAGPQQRTDFCRCHAQSDCGDPLDQPEGEMWETFLTEGKGETEDDQTLTEEDQTLSSEDQNLDSSSAARRGRCHGSGYMNLAWSGMSKSKCLERAFEVNKAPGPAGQCGYVSYSGSAGPQQRTDFCRCHVQSDCGDPLDQPEGEMWETLLTSDPTSPTIISSSAPRNLISLVSCAVAGMLVYPSP